MNQSLMVFLLRGIVLLLLAILMALTAVCFFVLPDPTPQIVIAGGFFLFMGLAVGAAVTLSLINDGGNS